MYWTVSSVLFIHNNYLCVRAVLTKYVETFSHEETLSSIGTQVLTKHPELEALKVVFLPQVSFLNVSTFPAKQWIILTYIRKQGWFSHSIGQTKS
jgi:hypothetical protein